MTEEAGETQRRQEKHEGGPRKTEEVGEGRVRPERDGEVRRGTGEA